jgi:hypothetical protein
LKGDVGAEALCTATFKGRLVDGKARLETNVLEFRGPDLRLSIRFDDMTAVGARDGNLTIKSPAGTASFDLGGAAEKWAAKILHPPSRLTKLGVKPTWRASAIGVEDQAFLEELEDAVTLLSIGKVLRGSDAIFFGATKATQLTRLEKLKAALQPAGALWIIRPKGRPEISEGAVMSAGKAAGLVDVKVVSFSATHTAEKFVIPRAARP